MSTSHDDREKLKRITDLIDHPQDKLFKYTPAFIATLERKRAELILKIR